MEKHPSVFIIASYDFIDRVEDYPEYIKRREISQKCQGSLTILQERCESNRSEAHSRLQTARETMKSVLDKSFQEMHMRVEQRYQQVKEELAALCIQLENFMSDKRSALSPTLLALQSTPIGALFRVGVGDTSLSLAKAAWKSCILLPLDEGMPQIDTAKKLLKKARDMTEHIGLSEVIRDYALELECSNSDLTTAVITKSQESAKGMSSWTATEQLLLDVVNQYLHSGVEAKKKGDYRKSLKKLERGCGLLQHWGVESAEMCLEVGAVYSHFGRRAEACTMLRRGLQSSSSLELRWKLSRGLVEVLFQTGEWEKTVEAAELLPASVESSQDAFELLQIIYFLTKSHYSLGNLKRGFELVDYWTSIIAAESVNGQCVLQLYIRREEG